jgi:chromosomal replication initiator protein
MRQQTESMLKALCWAHPEKAKIHGLSMDGEPLKHVIKEEEKEPIKKVVETVVKKASPPTPKKRRNEPKYEFIRRIVCYEYGIPVKDMLSESKRRIHVLPRQVAAFLMKSEISESTLSQIGGWLDRRDHTTILHSIRKVRILMENSKSFKEHVEEMRTRIRAYYDYPNKKDTISQQT